MKKSIFILVSIALFVCLAGVGLYKFAQHNKPIALVQQTKKSIVKQVNTTDDNIKTLVTQKVSLQKVLIQANKSVAEIRNTNKESVIKVLALSRQLKEQYNSAFINETKQEFTLQDSKNTCDSLAMEANQLANNVLEKDSLYLLENALHDSINCINENVIQQLTATNTYLLNKTDTLLVQLNDALKENKQLIDKINRTKTVNKLMSGSLLAIGGYALLSRVKYIN